MRIDWILRGQPSRDPRSILMEAYGKIVVLKRSGQDSASFELIDEKYTFGRYVEFIIFLWK